MFRTSVLAVLLAGFYVPAPACAQEPPAEPGPLEGVWNAKSMQADGAPAAGGAVSKLRLTFKGAELTIRGNFRDDREAACKYTLDLKPSPPHLDLVFPDAKAPSLAIFERKGDEMTLAFRKSGDDRGRPTDFVSKEGSGVLLMVFKKEPEVPPAKP